MPFTIARFDLDETVPIPNVPRPASMERQTLPTGFPFAFDERAQEVVEPILLFLASKYNSPDCHSEGEWTKKNSADAAAADLKDWWAHVQNGEVPWDSADDDLVAQWLVGMKSEISGRTKTFLEDATVKRRATTVSEFYRWALDRKFVERVPQPSSAKRLAAMRLATGTPAGKRYAQQRRGKYDRDPHPIELEHAARIAERLGPLPSEGRDDPSRSRLAFELGYETGMRIDEILHLDHELFATFVFDRAKPFVMSSLDIDHTKGLVRREVNIPAWLMNELSLYVAGERCRAVERAREVWLTGALPAPRNLLLNHTGSPQHVGKATQAATIQAEFRSACMSLPITKPRLLAKGTPAAKLVKVPKHTFHDTRHSFAVMFFRALEDKGRVRPWLRVQKALGHAHISTTMGIYLNVVDHLGSEALEEVGRYFSDARSNGRGGAAMRLAEREQTA